MAKLSIHDAVILRTPRFGLRSQLSDDWPLLKKLIKDASPDFYQVIADLSYADLAHAEDKIRFTVLKYYNRACYRATPYGGFATVSITRLSPENAVTIGEPVIHTFPDWAEAGLPASGPLNGDTLFFTNSSFYVLGNEIRYLQRQDREIHISAVSYDAEIMQVLKACSTPKCFRELVCALADSVPQAQLEQLLPALVEVQLLLTSADPNIIGKDYFARVGRPPSSETNYQIAERKARGGFDKRLFWHLPGLADRLSRLLAARVPADLQKFKEAFVRRFEQAEVPIMLALDPEAGVGYGDTAQHITAGDFGTVIGLPEQPVGDVNAALRERLLSALLEHNNYTIQLEDLITATDKEGNFPNSLAATCTVVDDCLWMDMMGGASAASMSGRFALAIPEIESYCRQITSAEQAANPDILFFDVGYTKEGKVDNVNRRPSIYDLQLNILNYDTSGAPLTLDDVYISVQRDEVVLRSLSRNKRILPRMATAYNYRRSDLSVFRLLMDIQSQDLQTNLTFRLPGLIPGLQFYPRIQFENIIVSPAAWRLPKQDLQILTLNEERRRFLQNWLGERLITNYIKIGSGDQTLCLALNSDEDMHLLVSLWLKQKDLLVEEAGVPYTSTVKDTEGFAYLHQVVVALQHNEPIAKPLTAVQERFPSLAGRIAIPPGNEWLYFQIFCAQHRSDEVLEKITGYLEESRIYLHQWFFIRYDEGGYHIRLRLLLKDTGIAYELIQRLSCAFHSELTSGIVSDIKLCTYKPEVNRYLPDQMPLVEGHFYADSEFVLATLPEKLTENARYRLCLDLFNAVQSSGVIGHHQLEHLVKKMTEAYNNEHRVQQAQFKVINSRFRTFVKEPEPLLSLNSAVLQERLKRSLVETLEAYPQLIRAKILADLLHMHINRLFSSDQRAHEMLFYNYLALILKRREHLASQAV